MSQLIIADSCCEQCGTALRAADNYCRICGLSTDRQLATTQPAEQGNAPIDATVILCPTANPPVPHEQSLVARVLENRFYVLAILLCVGPLGLPALWFSRRFSRSVKIATTVVYFTITVVIPLVVAWYLLDITLRPIVDVLG